MAMANSNLTTQIFTVAGVQTCTEDEVVEMEAPALTADPPTMAAYLQTAFLDRGVAKEEDIEAAELVFPVKIPKICTLKIEFITIF